MVMRARLRKAIRRLHGCNAAWVESADVREISDGETVWEGSVEVFEIRGHATAMRCYAWTSPTNGKDRIYAVLHLPPVDSPASAVRASIVQDRREGRI